MSALSDAISPNSTLHKFHEWSYFIGGVIHVGANDGGREVKWCVEMEALPVLCFEPLDAAFKRACEIWIDVPGVEFYKCALGERSGGLQFWIPEYGDDEKTSHLHPIPTDSQDWTKIPMGRSFWAQVYRFDEWMMHVGMPRQIDISKYKTLVIDVQGMEFEVLKGFGNYIHVIDFICVELSRVPLFQGEPPGEEVADWITSRGFEQATEIGEHQDVLFIREGVEPMTPNLERIVL